jgi:arylsulfatase A-like enzyme
MTFYSSSAIVQEKNRPVLPKFRKRVASQDFEVFHSAVKMNSATLLRRARPTPSRFRSMVTFYSWMLNACLLATISISCFSGQAAQIMKPNIVLILADDAGIGDFSAYGCKYGTTPNIDRLAREGMLFTRAYSGSAVCAPTRCVLMTGRHTGHAVRRANQSKDGLIPLPAGQATVASVLKQAGYATGGFGKWGLGNPGTTGVPEKHGFDLFYGYYDQVHAHDYFTDHLVRNSADVPVPGHEKQDWKAYSHTLIANETLKFIEQNKDKPFFCYAAWTLPHGNFVIPSNEPYSDKPWPKATKNYAAMIKLLDVDVGRVMQKLKELGLDDKTLVMFSSDNGANQQFVEHLSSTGELRGQKRFLYEGGIRAPFIARWPGRIAPGSISDLLISHVDFMATAAELGGVEAPKNDGISILPTLLGDKPRSSREHLYWEIYEPQFQQAVRIDDWKGYRTGTHAPLELYHLKDDPQEKNNVAATNPSVTKKIETIMAGEHTPSSHWDAPTMPRQDAKQSGKKRKGATGV